MAISKTSLVRDGFQPLTRKVAIELAVAVFSVILFAALAAYSTAGSVGPSRSADGRPELAGKPDSPAADAALENFMRRVALSYVTNIKPTPSFVAPPAPNRAPVLPLTRQWAHMEAKPTARAPENRSARTATKVAPAFGPTIATVASTTEETIDYKNATTTPDRKPMDFVAGVWRSTPNGGALVIDGFASMGHAITSLAKKLWS